MHPIERRIIDITYQEKLSHLSSVLSAWPIIDQIYKLKKDDEVFILSNGHAGLALYVILEERYGINAVDLLHKYGIHPEKDLPNKIYSSTGSLGSGLPIAVGHALADRSKNVYCMISDGEAAEGSIWESLAFIDKTKLTNLHIFANINGMSAYDYVDSGNLILRLKTFLPTIKIYKSSSLNLPGASGLKTHYHVLSESEYKELCASK